MHCLVLNDRVTRNEIAYSARHNRALSCRLLFAPGCQILTAYHPVEAKLRNSGRELAASMTIGNNVWLGAGVIVLPGVTIGDAAVVGAGSIVTKSVPANSLAVGNPARVIREISNE